MEVGGHDFLCVFSCLSTSTKQIHHQIHLLPTTTSTYSLFVSPFLKGSSQTADCCIQHVCVHAVCVCVVSTTGESGLAGRSTLCRAYSRRDKTLTSHGRAPFSVLFCCSFLFFYFFIAESRCAYIQPMNHAAYARDVLF